MATIRNKCVTSIKAAVGDKMTREQVKTIVDQVFDMADRDPALALSTAAKLKRAARTLNEAQLVEAQVEKRQRAINILRYREITNRLEESRRGSFRELLAMTVGLVDGEEMSGFSVDARAKALERKWAEGMILDLRKAGVLERFTGSGIIRRRDPAFERDVAVEMSRLNGGKDGPTGNHEAVKMAEIFNKYGEAARVARNKAGAFIGKRQGYIIAQTHDMAKLRRAGFDAWRDWIAPRLDESTFVGVADKDAFLRRVYTALASGVHLGREEAMKGDFKFLGPGNLAKRLSQGRVLHFKDAGAWFDYNERFGQGNVYEGVDFNLRRAARDTVVMNTFGVNPEAMFQRVVEDAMRKAEAAGDLAEMDKLKTGTTGKGGFVPGLRDQFRAAIGIDDIPGNPKWANFHSGVRAWISMTKLGGMVLSSFSDLGARASVMRKNGVNYVEGLSSGVQALMRGRGSDEMKEAANLLGVGADGIRGAVLARLSAGDSVPGSLSSMLGHFFRLNGAQWWMDAMSSGLGTMLSHNLTRYLAKPFGEIDARLRQTLGRYGIGEADWAKLQQTQTRIYDGTAMIFADDVADEALAEKLRTYFIDQTHEGMTMGGAAERAFVTQFGPPGSLSGEVARYAMQFKNFPLTFARRHIGGHLKRGDYSGLASLILAMTALGFVSRAVKDIARGREPNVDFATALLQGGGLGIYGDFLLGEYDRFGRTLGEAVMGPTVSTVSNWASIFTRIAKGGLEWEGDPGKIGARFLQVAVDTTPFANLFYTRAALDYLILYQLQEMMDPGSLRRKEQRMKSQNNAEFIFRPSRAIPYGGGDRLFEGVR